MMYFVILKGVESFVHDDPFLRYFTEYKVSSGIKERTLTAHISDSSKKTLRRYVVDKEGG